MKPDWVSAEKMIEENIISILKEQNDQQISISKALPNDILTNTVAPDVIRRGFQYAYKQALKDNGIPAKNAWVEFDDGGCIYINLKIKGRPVLVNEDEYIAWLQSDKRKAVKLIYRRIKCDDTKYLNETITALIWDIKHLRIDDDNRKRRVYDYQIGMFGWSLENRASYYTRNFINPPEDRIIELTRPYVKST